MDKYHNQKTRINYFQIKKMHNLEVAVSDLSKTYVSIIKEVPHEPHEAINFLKENNILSSFKNKENRTKN